MNAILQSSNEQTNILKESTWQISGEKLTPGETSPTLCKRINSICSQPTANALEESSHQIIGETLRPRWNLTTLYKHIKIASVVIQQRTHWGNHSIRYQRKNFAPGETSRTFYKRMNIICSQTKSEHTEGIIYQKTGEKSRSRWNLTHALQMFWFRWKLTRAPETYIHNKARNSRTK